jgi:hypothetical protein
MSAAGMLSDRQLGVVVIAVARFFRSNSAASGRMGTSSGFEVGKNVQKILAEGAGIVSWNCELEVFAKHAIARVHKFGLPLRRGRACPSEARGAGAVKFGLPLRMCAGAE